LARAEKESLIANKINSVISKDNNKDKVE